MADPHRNTAKEEYLAVSMVRPTSWHCAARQA